MNIDLKRSEYDSGKLDRNDLKESPFDQFAVWFDYACQNNVIEPNAMSLATAWADGRPLVRTVLLKGYGPDGFVFFTNVQSRKGRQLAENPQASLLFPWLALQRQVIITGRVERAAPSDTKTYFATRPRGSQIGAWISEQSAPVASRAVLEKKWSEMEQKFGAGEIPVPEWWSGFRVIPNEIEFWQGRASRLHDRFLYKVGAGGIWAIERLSP